MKSKRCKRNACHHHHQEVIIRVPCSCCRKDLLEQKTASHSNTELHLEVNCDAARALSTPPRGDDMRAALTIGKALEGLRWCHITKENQGSLHQEVQCPHQRRNFQRGRRANTVFRNTWDLQKMDPKGELTLHQNTCFGGTQCATGCGGLQHNRKH